LIITLLMFFMGCDNGSASYTELKGGVVNVKVIGPSKKKEPFKVRIQLDKDYVVRSTGTQRMMYAADSLFYLADGHRKQYAAQVEFIANGIPRCYEYLIYFDGGEPKGSLVYNDRYLTGEEYIVILKKN
jgi:hypothetical protein